MFISIMTKILFLKSWFILAFKTFWSLNSKYTLSAAKICLNMSAIKKTCTCKL